MKVTTTLGMIYDWSRKLTDTCEAVAGRPEAGRWHVEDGTMVFRTRVGSHMLGGIYWHPLDRRAYVVVGSWIDSEPRIAETQAYLERCLAALHTLDQPSPDLYR